MGKLAYITRVFTVGISFAIEDLEEIYDIKWENVEDYDIKYGALYIKMKDRTVHEHDFYIEQGDIAGKYPDKIVEYDNEWNVIEEENNEQ